MAIQSANALIVSVQDQGEVPAEGIDLLITEGEEDVLSGLYTMELQGNLLANSSQIQVHITRSATGLTDEFCCGSNCTAGNGETAETKSFDVSGVASWYAHYVPAPGSDVTISYTFQDGAESVELRVRYLYTAEGIRLQLTPTAEAKKMLRDGQLVIRCNQQEFNINGNQL